MSNVLVLQLHGKEKCSSNFLYFFIFNINSCFGTNLLTTNLSLSCYMDGVSRVDNTNHPLAFESTAKRIINIKGKKA